MKGKNILIYSLIVIVVGVLGFAGGTLYGTQSGIPDLINNTVGTAPPEGVDFSTFWKSWAIVQERYAPADEQERPSEEDLVFGAVSGIVDALGDPYSEFLPPQELASFEEDISGNFGGVGMEVGIREDELTVISPLPDTPAEKAGILPGDKILRIDEQSATDLSINKAVSLIRGESGTIVKLTLSREGVSEPFEVDVVRAVITIPVVETELRNDGVFVLRLFSFTGNSSSEFRMALREFVLSGSDKLILDLRGNPGGFLLSAVDIASWFLPTGKVVVSESLSSSGEDQIFRSKGYDIFTDKLNMVVLVNGGSASASEIVAGALQEHGVATIIGTQTFGKGSVQELIDVTNESALKITTAQWLTPNGNSISDGGLMPDVVVEMSLEDIEAGRDPQLESAVSLILGQ